MKEFYALSVEGKPKSEWHLLEDHLLGTAKLTAQFADEFGSGDWAYLAGLWHVGKFIKGMNIKNIGHSLGEVG